ncbi:MAG: hypothetical protein U0Z75_00005 [Deinococcaceae bacterium]
MRCSGGHKSLLAKNWKDVAWKLSDTPVIPIDGHWENLSIIGGMTLCGKQATYQHSCPHAIRAVQVVKFFKHLPRYLEGPRVVLLDNARISPKEVVVLAKAAPRLGPTTAPSGPGRVLDQTCEASEFVCKESDRVRAGLEAGLSSGEK